MGNGLDVPVLYFLGKDGLEAFGGCSIFAEEGG